MGGIISSRGSKDEDGIMMQGSVEAHRFALFPVVFFLCGNSASWDWSIHSLKPGWPWKQPSAHNQNLEMFMACVDLHCCCSSCEFMEDGESAAPSCDCGRVPNVEELAHAAPNMIVQCIESPSFSCRSNVQEISRVVSSAG